MNSQSKILGSFGGYLSKTHSHENAEWLEGSAVRGWSVTANCFLLKFGKMGRLDANFDKNSEGHFSVSECNGFSYL